MRFNKFGGPGAGKSTRASISFGRLKQAGKSVELAREFVKDWVYQGRKIMPLDQITLLGAQWNEEHKYLGHGVKNVVTDSPIFLGYIYSKKYFPEFGIHEPILELVQACERQYPSVNMFLDRGEKPYDPIGRFQTHDEAKGIDALIREEMDALNMKYYVFDYGDEEGITNFVLDNCD